MDRFDLPPLAHAEFGNNPWDPPDFLRSVSTVHGVAFHLDFFLVHLDDDDVQRAATPELDERLALLRRACGARGPFATVEMEDAPYVLFMSPTCST